MEALCTTIAKRAVRMLARRALSHEDPEERVLALALSRSAARHGVTRHAPEGTDPDHDHDGGWKRKAHPVGYREARRVDGFDLECTTVVRGDDRERLEHVCASTSCGHRMKLVAVIFEKKSLARFLCAHGLSERATPLAPARAPPQTDFDFGP